MSNSVWLHRQQPTRLPHPWDSPGKNTGVGCHFLLQCLKVKSESEVAQLCPTPSHPMDCSPPASSVHGIFQARGLEWGAIAFSNYCALTICCCWLVAKSYLTLYNTMECSLPISSVHGILQARILCSGLPFPSPGDLPKPEMETVSSALQADSLPLNH